MGGRLPAGTVTQDGNAHHAPRELNSADGGRNSAPFARYDFTAGLEFTGKCGMPDTNSLWQQFQVQSSSVAG
jgi:hypothetical protein